MSWRVRTVFAMLLAVVVVAPVHATPLQYVDFPLNGRKLTLALYRPPRPPVGTIIMGSGDVGWVGLAATMADYLSDQGYFVVGVNVRQYLAAFTAGTAHLTVAEPPADYRALLDWLQQQQLLVRPVILSGMSEGAALAVLVAADRKNHERIDGVVTMGIPAVAELAWRWKDIGSWITKSDAREPSFAPCEFAGDVSPVPLVMLQSTRDEYVSEADYTHCHAAAREPKKLILIDANNHRFTNRRPELRQQYLAALDWIRGHAK
jgi:dienelactone hydrolase